MKGTIAFIFCLFVSITFIFAVHTDLQKNKKEDLTEIIDEELIYQGPIMPNMDEKHFRKTGETIYKNNN